MRLIDRIFSKSGFAHGIAWHTPDQHNFRERAQGRWAADVTLGANAPACHVAVRPSGCVDVTVVEPHDNHWIDLGGRGGIDFSVGRI